MYWMSAQFTRSILTIFLSCRPFCMLSANSSTTIQKIISWNFFIIINMYIYVCPTDILFLLLNSLLFIFTRVRYFQIGCVGRLTLWGSRETTLALAYGARLRHWKASDLLSNNTCTLFLCWSIAYTVPDLTIVDINGCIMNMMCEWTQQVSLIIIPGYLFSWHLK